MNEQSCIYSFSHSTTFSWQYVALRSCRKFCLMDNSDSPEDKKKYWHRAQEFVIVIFFFFFECSFVAETCLSERWRFQVLVIQDFIAGFYPEISW